MSEIHRVADAFTAWVDKHSADLPLPGSGRTGERWAALAAVARDDVALARLAEGHADAVAILAELSGPPVSPGSRWGVWAAEPPDPVVSGTESPGGWLLTGRKPWCSGAHACTHALVTARTEDGRRLFAVDLTQPEVAPIPDTWPAVGMAGSDSGEVRFDAAEAVPVGGIGQYVDRPGFWHGAIGVAACWYGGAGGVADTLLDRARAGRADDHAQAHLGAVDAALHAAHTTLDAAAVTIDAAPGQDARLLALRVRAAVEETCREVLHRVGRATGAAPLCGDVEHARRVADLTVFVRQSHAERDLAALGGALADGADPSW